MTTVLLSGTTTTTTATIAVGTASGTANDAATALSAGMPSVLPASELYFWSEKWQAQEREFERARAAGELIEADSMDEVIADLMRVDEMDD
jgi:hypothetical protein